MKFDSRMCATIAQELEIIEVAEAQLKDCRDAEQTSFNVLRSAEKNYVRVVKDALPSYRRAILSALSIGTFTDADNEAIKDTIGLLAAGMIVPEFEDGDNTEWYTSLREAFGRLENATMSHKIDKSTLNMAIESARTAKIAYNKARKAKYVSAK